MNLINMIKMNKYSSLRSIITYCMGIYKHIYTSIKLECKNKTRRNRENGIMFSYV